MTPTISLSKDNKVDLTKTNPGLTKVHVGLGWDVSSAKKTPEDEFDLDVFAFVLHNGTFSKKLDNVVFYGTKKEGVTDQYPMIQLSPDNRTGAGDGDDEYIKVDFQSLPPEVDALIIGVSIYDAINRGQNFGMVKNSYISVASEDNQATPIVKYDLQEDFSSETIVMLGKLYKHNGEWKFEAMGNGMVANIEEAAAIY